VLCLPGVHSVCKVIQRANRWFAYEDNYILVQQTGHFVE
jgi:hypothetical protein